MIRILRLSDEGSIKEEMRKIKVDPYGIEIMLPKARHYLLQINNVSNITANILKQEMLSLGGDVAVARDALTGHVTSTDCLMMGNLSQLERLNQKLQKQPFGLGKVAQELSVTLRNYQMERFALACGRFKLNLGTKTHIMGIVNLTPDSFSGDGLYQKVRSSEFGVRSEVLKIVERMIEDGADMIDIGGESTRPQARKISVKEEISRTLPVIKVLAKRIRVPISIDTYKPEVAKRALDVGAVMVNDITGLKDPQMIKVVKEYEAGVVIMHMKGTPRTMQRDPHYVSLIEEIIRFLSQAIRRSIDAGISREKIVIDPGLGFGKTPEHNLKLLNSLEEFKVLGRPLLVGPSRKSFIGKILNVEPQERLSGTISSCVLAAHNGAKILRVHDVKEVHQALKIYDAVTCN
ncbi:MAG: hypothetical protein AMJ95_01770 [Omnitrophica WOR_2 bacterium SM23_72]|nr:MAG: hypothetical protein AMJ95_01770 [Omnitrophica WOR_2 bacterium SM23_72]